MQPKTVSNSYLEIERAHSASHFAVFLHFQTWWYLLPYSGGPSFLRCASVHLILGRAHWIFWAVVSEVGAWRVIQSAHHVETLQAVFMFRSDAPMVSELVDGARMVCVNGVFCVQRIVSAILKHYMWVSYVIANSNLASITQHALPPSQYPLLQNSMWKCTVRRQH